MSRYDASKPVSGGVALHGAQTLATVEQRLSGKLTLQACMTHGMEQGDALGARFHPKDARDAEIAVGAREKWKLVTTENGERVVGI